MNMENEDEDILNVEFDATELEGIDEDELLGAVGSKTETAKKSTSAPSVSTPASSQRPASPLVPTEPSPVQNDELHVDAAQTSGEGIEQDSIDESKSADSAEDEDEDTEDDKDRSKFRTDRSGIHSDHRPAIKRTGIPDSLDNVKINQKDAQFIRSPPKKRRDMTYPPRYGSVPGVKKILLNPHFQGSVPIRPQMRLAWDMSDRQQQTLHIGAMKLTAPMPMPPSVIRQPPPGPSPLCMPNQMGPLPSMIQPPSHSAQSMLRPLVSPMSSPPRPAPPPVPLASVPSSVYRFPPPPMWTSSQPPAAMTRQVFSRGPLMGPSRPPAMFASAPPGNSVLQPLPNYSVPPPRLAPPMPKPLNSLPTMAKPPPSLSTGSNEWLNMTEDFLRKTQMPPPPFYRHPSASDTFSPPKSISRQRQAADVVKRKYRVQEKQKKLPLSSRKSTEESSVERPDTNVRIVRVDKPSVDGVDADYLRKLEEQKRQRELILKRKELRRSQMAKTRQEQLSIGTNGTSTSGPMPIKRAEISLASSTAPKPMVGRRYL